MTDGNRSGQFSIEAANEAVDDFLAGKIDINEIGESAGFKPDPPFTYHTPGKSLWQFIPFYETIFLRLRPLFDERLFTVFHGFQPTDEQLNEVLDLIAAGRIQPLLNETPSRMELLLQLEAREHDGPILSFYESVLNHDPRVHMEGSGLAMYWLETNEQEVAEQYWDEVAEVIGIDVQFEDRNGDDVQYQMDVLRAETYILLRTMGYHSLAKDCLDHIQTFGDGPSAPLLTAGKFVTDPALDTLVEQYPVPLSVDESLDPGIARISRETELPTAVSSHLDEAVLSNATFPTEVGQLLLERRVPRLDSKNAAMTLYDKCETADLHKYLSGLTDGVESTGNKSEIVRSREELNQIIDQVWDDIQATKQTNHNRRQAFRLLIAVAGTGVGTVTAGPAGATAGLLASLGMELLDDQLDAAADRTSMLFQPQYVVNVIGAEESLDDSIIT